MRKVLLTIAIACCAILAAAQDPSIEIKDISGFGQKKFRGAPKKVYISQFRVNYQLLYSQTETAEGGRTLGGGYRGEAKAGLTMAVQGIEAADLMQITDKLYADFVSGLTNAGYELLSADDAAKAKNYQGWERKAGGTLNESQYPGYITAIPTGYEYFVKKTNESGREKTGFGDNTLKVSNDIGAPVIRVNLVIPFVEDAESHGSKALGKVVGGLAKVVLRPYLRLEKDPVATAGGFSTDAAQTKVTYGFMEGMGTQAISNLCLKSSIDIPGIFEDKKYKAVESADQDLWGTSYGALTIFNVSDVYLKKTQPLPCDAAKYKQGVGEAAGSYLKATLDEFLSYDK